MGQQIKDSKQQTQYPELQSGRNFLMIFNSKELRPGRNKLLFINPYLEKLRFTF